MGHTPSPDPQTQLREISHLLSHLQGAVTTLSRRLDVLDRALHPHCDSWAAMLIAPDLRPGGDSEMDRPTVDGVKRLLAEFLSSRKIYGTDEQGRLTVLMQASAPEALGAAELVRRRLARMPRRLRPPDSDGVLGGEVLTPGTVSIGLALSDEKGSDAGRLIDAATQALENAQTHGSNQVKVA